VTDQPEQHQSSDSAESSQPMSDSGELSVSRQLLNDIRQQLGDLESKLTEPEQRLLQLQRQLRDNEAKLASERQQAAAERERTQQLNDLMQERDQRLAETEAEKQDLVKKVQELTEREGRLAEQVHVLKEQVKSLSQQISSLSEQRNKTLGTIRKARQRLELQSRQIAVLNKQYAESQRHFAVEPRPAHELIQSETELGANGENGSDSSTAIESLIHERSRKSGGWWRSLSAGWKTIFVVVVLLIFACGILSILIYQQSESSYRITGQLIVPVGETDILSACQNRVAAQATMYDLDHKAMVIRQDPVAGILELSLKTTNPTIHKGRLDELGMAVAEDMQSNLTPTPASQPVDDDRIKQLDKQLKQVTGKLKQFTDAPRGKAQDLLSRQMDSWQKMLEERRRVVASLTELTEQLSKAEQHGRQQVKPNPKNLQEAEAKDRKLQADIETLAQRKAELTALLREILKKNIDHFASLSTQAQEGVDLLDETLKAGHDREVNESLQAMRECLTEWLKLSSDLAQVWRTTMSSLAEPVAERDPVQSQVDLKKAAKTFVDDTSASLLLFSKSLDSIAQGGDQPTKRIVLHNKLAHDLKPVLEAREKLATAAKLVLLSYNRSLATLTQQVIALQTQVKNRRYWIESALRQKAQTELNNQHNRDLMEKRAERDRLDQRLSELDQLISAGLADAMTAIDRHHRLQASLAEQINLYQRQTDLLNRLSDLNRNRIQELADVPKPIEVRYLPAVIHTLPTPRGRQYAEAVLIGVAPFVILVILIGIVGILESSRQSRRAMDDYNRALREALSSPLDSDQLNEVPATQDER